MEQLNKLGWKQIRKYKTLWTVLIKFVKTTKVEIRHHASITQLKEDNDRQTQIERKLYTPTGHQSWIWIN